ncbi:hypothetical protein B7P43_G07674, partial [Cryptotermes secundus]
VQIATSTRILIKKMNKLQMQWQRTHNMTLCPLINTLKEQIDLAIKEQLLNTWQKTLQGWTPKAQDTWRVTKSLTNTNPNIPTITITGNTSTTIQRKLNTFADTLEQIYTINLDGDRTFTVRTEQVLSWTVKKCSFLSLVEISKVSEI